MNGKIKLLIIAGIFITALPLLNIPRGSKTPLIVVIGIGTILLSVSLKREVKILKLKLKRSEGQQGVVIQ